MVKCEGNCNRDFKKRSRITSPVSKKGLFVNNEINPVSEAPAFSTEDVLWALGIWSVILTLSPVIVFYMLMVA